MHRGYIKLYRKILDSPYWQEKPFTRGQAWVDLLLLANHRDSHIRVRGSRIEVKRGQVGHSEISLSGRWGWSRGKVRRFLSELASETVQQIEQQKNFLSSVISIKNFAIYNDGGTADRTANGQQTDSRRYTNKNDKNDKKYIYISEKLRDSILDQSASAKITKKQLCGWAKDVRLMIERDGRTEGQITEMIDRVFKDDFWSGVIRSMGKLRKHWNDGKLDNAGKKKGRRKGAYVESGKKYGDWG